MNGGPLFAIGDIHGQYDKLIALLEGARLIDDSQRWLGGTARLWFTGDFFDRGPQGLESAQLVMRLQAEADAAGGKVGSLLGNHEVMFLGAHRFGDYRPPWGSTFRDLWEFNGGRERDMDGLTNEVAAWIADLPAMAREDDVLLVHSDSTFYTTYGQTVEAVNSSVRAAMHSDDPTVWASLMEPFFDRLAFTSQGGGEEAARELLRLYGGELIVHGHTPIPYLAGTRAERVREPVRYAGGLAVDIDGGMFLGGDGFVVALSPVTSGEG